jgi:hypothetical protein
MSTLRLLTLWCVVGLLLAFAAAQTANIDLPPGAMQNKVHTACTTCHDAHIIVQQRLGKAAWGKEVDKMVKWGAILDSADRDSLIEYLSTSFPVDKPPYAAQRSARKH